MKVTIYQDTVCPWCRLGKSYFQQALEQWEGPKIEVEYKTYFLNQNIPEQGIEYKKHLIDKFGTEEKVQEMFDRISTLGQEIGLEYNFDKIEREPNSILSHELVKLVPENRRNQVLDKIYEAFFELGRDIGKVDVLVNIADQMGFDRTEIRNKLDNHIMKEKVMKDYEQAKKIGVNGVPYFMINDEIPLYGAHKPDMLLRSLNVAKNRENIQLDLTSL